MIEYEIKGNYGQGWELLTTESNRAEAENRLKEYNDNEPEYAHKITKRRQKQSTAKWPQFGSGAGSGK